jgi:4-phytase/acid phosphatase
LLQTVLDALEGRTAPAFPGEPVAPAAARLVVIAGHDTNIANLAGVLGLQWTLPGQPDDTPPGGALVFEVWRDAGGAAWVRARFVYQTLEQLRSLTPLDAAHPAGAVDLPPPCAETGKTPFCQVQPLADRLRRQAQQACKSGG